jgi:hypothetical protein
MILVLRLLTATLLTIELASLAHAQVSDRLRRGHALLIGNFQYQDTNWPPLDDVPLQLAALASGLKAHFETVDVAKNLKTEELRQKINGFLRTYGNDPTARLFVYYAGHGYTETILQRNENRGYITGIDTPHFSRGYDTARLSAISMMEIRAPIAEVLAQHILFVFDSCFAGTIFTTRSTPSKTELTSDVVSRLLEKPSRDFITAGRANEYVPAHSPLPELFLAAINGEADQYHHGVVSASEIAQYLKDKLLPRSDLSLTPQEGKLPDPPFAEGEFLFRVISTGTTAAPPTPQSPAEKLAMTPISPPASTPATSNGDKGNLSSINLVLKQQFDIELGQKLSLPGLPPGKIQQVDCECLKGQFTMFQTKPRAYPKLTEYIFADSDERVRGIHIVQEDSDAEHAYELRSLYRDLRKRWDDSDNMVLVDSKDRNINNASCSETRFQSDRMRMRNGVNYLYYSAQKFRIFGQQKEGDCFDALPGQSSSSTPPLSNVFEHIWISLR